jgi:hypothetical protein
VPDRIVVGTSSWTDPGFVEEWYPEGLPARDRLAFYAERFEGVEVNATWYAVPAEATVGRWVEQTPPGFTFDVKLHRLLSGHATTEQHLPKDLRPLARTDGRGRVLPDAPLQDALVERILEGLAPLAAAGSSPRCCSSCRPPSSRASMPSTSSRGSSKASRRFPWRSSCATGAGSTSPGARQRWAGWRPTAPRLSPWTCRRARP